MDFSSLKKIKVYSDQIIKFKELSSNQNLSGSEFYNKMKNIFPKFNSDYPGLFKNICYGKDLHILDFMFKKLDDIEEEYNQRKSEVLFIKPFIEFSQNFLKDRDLKKVTGNRLISEIIQNKSLFSQDYRIFINKYPKIIERLVDDEFECYDPEILLYEEIKYKHEVMVGKALKTQYIDPVLNENKE